MRQKMHVHVTIRYSSYDKCEGCNGAETATIYIDDESDGMSSGTDTMDDVDGRGDACEDEV